MAGMEINFPVGNPGSTNKSDGGPGGYSDRQGAALTSGYHGDYYNAAYRGRLFHGCGVVAANSFPIYTSTAIVFGLWNASSEVNLELVKFSAAYVSGTAVAGPVGYNTKDVGLAVGVPLSAFNPTPLGVRPGLMGGSGSVSKAKFTNAATNTVVAAAAADFIPGNAYLSVITAADATQGIVQGVEEWFHGSIILAPGMIWWPCALLASVSLFAMRVVWIEVPV